MMVQIQKNQAPSIRVEKIDAFEGADLEDLCDATESTARDNALSFSIGLNNTLLHRERLKTYWKGVLLVPQRTLIVGRLDNVIASSIQLERPAANNQTQAFCGNLDHHFVAPWARGHGLAKALVAEAEQQAKLANLSVLRLSVRSNLEAAINLYEALGYKRWGTLDKYEMVDGEMLSGHFYYKELN